MNCGATAAGFAREGEVGAYAGVHVQGALVTLGLYEVGAGNVGGKGLLKVMSK